MPIWRKELTKEAEIADIKAEIANVTEKILKFGEALKDIDKRLAVLEESLSCILEDFEKKTGTSLLTADELQLRRELTIKLERKTISQDEARRLQDILKKEYGEARKANNFLVIVAILLLLGRLVIAILGRG